MNKYEWFCSSLTIFSLCQSRKKDELLCRDTLELEASLQEQQLNKEQESPAEEKTARLREVGRPEDTEAGPEV